ncbi:hypothetical protein [Psychroflexus aestuariivivens]|uniref:hypothetical protein n=1 Tax=Psychroflexus aestuariivivens TaxID=1795040 RepID=UPI000FD7F39F|nr:hypothetical protein [Psychroflexus aestuariivivens]
MRIINKILEIAKQNLTNLSGWHTKRKIVVFESDDWGATRMYDKDAYKYLLNKGYPVDNCPYNRNDRIESNEDVSVLAETLLKYKDQFNHPAKFTLNNIVANPDFDKIKASDFQEYHYETFQTTLSRYEDADQVVDLLQEGIQKELFQPQLHGREHINVELWLKRLQAKEQRFLDAFEQKMYTVTGSGKVSGRRDNLDTYGSFETKGKYHDYSKNIRESQELFFKAWGFNSQTFIAPCYVWHPNLEQILVENKIKGIQGTHVQRVPLQTGFQVKKKYHFTGQINALKQVYLNRNVMFEPAENPQVDVVNEALKQINLAFKYNKPAIISSHRLNYIGGLNYKNRTENIKKLDILLMAITKQWKHVEFMSSDQLINLINK